MVFILRCIDIGERATMIRIICYLAHIAFRKTNFIRPLGYSMKNDNKFPPFFIENA